MRYLTLIIVFLLFSCQWSPVLASVPNDAKQHQRELTRNARCLLYTSPSPRD